ncbi:MAG: phosphoribosylaminoimidazolecarboxamide formyltransferase / cyclohydrolase [Blastocatellia bacterium]|jgi:phosphoribosylaminoimidazolecarboxamide formyltransferase/IMP cyclohydrolase|nr:phosphoribosylaminoimidazolecarboxamide formyltransferase / cyclohydrolase [Blastocatellia bacterium]
MTDNNSAGLVRIRRALISVSDKTGIVDFARELKTFGVEIISTGGTAKILRDEGIDVLEVSDVTGFPEMMGGRVKTLHPKIHGALLALRDNAEHVAAMERNAIEPIDMVVINLYPFEETIGRDDVSTTDAIEQIDIGGPALIRSAAKNYRDVAVITSPEIYRQIRTELIVDDGSLTLASREQLARLAFMRTAIYDSAIFPYLTATLDGAKNSKFFPAIPELLAPMQTYMNLFSSAMKAMTGQQFPEAADEEFADQIRLSFDKLSDLRYGENPHQSAALYEYASRDRDDNHSSVARAELLSGKQMSFNNYVDADAAWQLVCDFDELTCAIIKHTNPAGVAFGDSGENAYRRALATDPVSAFGGIVAFNRKVDAAAARAVVEIFTEVIIAPEYDPDAVEILSTKKNLRVLSLGPPNPAHGVEYKQIAGGMLVQTRDTHKLRREDLKVVTKRQPTNDELTNLFFAWIVCKHTKSNAIVYVRDQQTVGVGAGQMSRVDSVKIGAMRAQLPMERSVIASDAFFPFRDGVDEAAKHGITAVIQPGGSVRDAEIIAAADELGLAMVFTGIRHFKH